MNSAPLAHLKVVELAGLGPCPCAGMLLADMGAQVTLVDRPGGGELPVENDGSLPLFHRGKKRIEADVKSPEGIAEVLALVAEADVFIEGFRPGVLERLGLSPEQLHQHNPKLVVGRLSGYGQTGPLAQHAGHEPNYMAIAGGLWHSGDKDSLPTAPLTSGADFGSAMLLVNGVLAACLQAQQSGKGQVVDVGISDTATYMTSLQWYLKHQGLLPETRGRSWANGAAPWSNNYRTQDGGYISLCALEPKFYRNLLVALALDEDPVFANQWDLQQWPEGKARLTALFLSQSRTHWDSLLMDAEACYAPILSPEEAVQHPHNQARQAFIQDEQGKFQPACGVKFS